MQEMVNNFKKRSQIRGIQTDEEQRAQLYMQTL
jgi:hypothetical protein